MSTASPTNTYWNDEKRVGIRCGDALGWALAEAAYNLIVTSPPYNLGVEYTDSDDKLDAFALPRFIANAAHAMFEAAHANGRLCLNIPIDTAGEGGGIPSYHDWLTALEAVGWRYRNTIIWNEGNISRRTAWGSWMSASAPNVICPCETILVMYKGSWRRGKAGTSDITAEEFKDWTLGHWTFPGENPKRVQHPAPFPEELAYRLIKLYSFQEDLVCDPFCGSGTTVAVAARLGRAAVGVDISEEYCKVASERVRKVVES
jgi:site-specific DNA-methyltransferase (adenine-specific)